ncbi:voltage-gated potassium channel protein [Eoetvoesia caeni]|uniref:Voltage-gated potassium channel n=1 Tax=Eoetvoesiella caeni TaxID=645616 RepID=A0A366HGE1_9BURK|nr:voltage-gated potassium channel protein [Eoetvoesiella caeni]MCI2808542.1 voltage-gated potassium channel protein [Eoetvoesiella caeni]NYT55082.1 voltage-gated potassium channel protein [Eoetvoesiella caeni]RBP40939.1 voltage-gated potassium channel [Eoetvoesiella caeni]
MKLLLLSNKLKRWHETLPLHWLLAVLVAINGFVLLRPGIMAVYAMHPSSGWNGWLNADSVSVFLDSFGLLEIPRLMLGAGLQLMALGLIFKARIAWTVSLLLLACTCTFFLWRPEGRFELLIYTVVLIVMLLAYWRRFDRSSLAAGSLFTVFSITFLLVYAVFGALYLGGDFRPHITDTMTALYFSIVSMSTVGYGDITPQTDVARMFTASIIILGITVFATSISAIAGPIIGGNVQRLVKGKLSRPMRKNHIIIAGATPLAQSVYTTLHERGHAVTVIVRPDTTHPYPDQADILVGDPSDTAVLQQAGASQALYVLALRDDDPENAFIILAAKEVCGEQTRTVALANTATHLKKIKQVGPDIVFSLQSLGAEILSRTVAGEPIDNDMITKLLFQNGTGPADPF